MLKNNTLLDILRDPGILRYDVLGHFHDHDHLVLKAILFFFQCLCLADRLSNDLDIGDDLFLLRQQLIECGNKCRLDFILHDVSSHADRVVVLVIAAVHDLAVSVRGVPDLRSVPT